MKTNLTIILLIICMINVSSVKAQESVIEDINYSQLERLIELAKENYPRRKIMDLNAQKAKAQAPIERLGYLDMFNAAYYYRPDEKASINYENPYNVNGFQFGVYVSLGSLLDRPYRIKQAVIDYEIAKLEQEDYEKILVAEVKVRYYAYILQLKELKLVTQNAQDAKGIADDIALRFERNEIEIDAYNASKNAFNSANSSKIKTEIEFLTAKDRLEEIVGKKLSEIEGL